MLRRSPRPRRASALQALLTLTLGLGLAVASGHSAAPADPDALAQQVADARQRGNPAELRAALEQLGRARYTTGAFPAAFAALDEAAKLPIPGDAVAPAAHAELLLYRGDAARQGAAPDVAEAALRAAVAAYDPLGAEGAKGRVNARNLLASLFIYRLHARYDEAERLLQEALAIAERTLGPESSHAASVLSNLGKVLELRGENDAAEQTMRRALAVMERTAGPEARTTMISLRTLAYHYLQRGLPDLAEPLSVRIYETERRLRPQHPATAAAAGELGWLFHTLGDAARGEPLLREALALREKTLGPAALETALSLAHLGVLLDSTGRSAEAVPLLRRCLEIRRRLLPEQSEAVAGAMSILGDALGKTGASDEALTCLRRARELRAALKGPDDREVAYSCIALARTLAHRGELAAARVEAAEAWRIARTGPTVSAADRSEIAGLVAALAIAAGDETAARAAVAIAQQEYERLFAATLGFTSEPQRLALLRGYAPLDLPASAGDAPTIARAVLRTKGLVLDSLLEDEQQARRQADPATDALLGRLRRARTAALAHPTTPLFEEAELLEKELATRVQGVGGRRRALAVDPAAVQSALPAGSALIEFVRYEQIGPRLGRTPTYGALVMAPGIPLVWRRLGEEPSIRRAVEQLKLLAQSGGPAGWLETAHAALLAPLLAVLPPGTTKLYLAPDGLLHSVPWSVLRDREQRFVAERYTLAGVGTGRDLLPPPQSAPPASRELVVLAAPHFDRPETARPTIALTGPRVATAARWRGVSLHDLPGAQREGEEIGRLAHAHGLAARVFSGAAASETSLRGVRAPRILHLATHGFVLPAAPGATAMDTAGLALAGGRTTLQAWQRGETPAPGDDGILTAREAAALDLHGTDLVVLSACDTAAGEAIDGEGVFGLRRGFARAGVRNLLLTLWPVADADTTTFMRGFYARLLAGAAPEDALAAVRLETLRTIATTRGPVAAARVAGAFVIDVRR
jgi:CHAT domain-containing protein/tetratricopeptide (TPR) repeat protein